MDLKQLINFFATHRYYNPGTRNFPSPLGSNLLIENSVKAIIITILGTRVRVFIINNNYRNFLKTIGC